MPCDFGRSWANIYGISVGWLENTRISTQPICYLYWKTDRNILEDSYYLIKQSGKSG